MIREVLLLFTLAVLCQGINSSKLKLKQVLIFSRHNIRTTIRPDLLPRYSPKKWPIQHQRPGQLTKKGALLEGYMGQYFKQWLESEHFFQEKCPSADSVYVYANSINRTVQTAEAFIESAFKGCNLTVHRKHTTREGVDAIFHAVIHNKTDKFITMVYNEIKRKLDNIKLTTAYLELNSILDIKDSEICERKSICDLTDISKSNISIIPGHELWVHGPLYIASTVMDSFVMSYYEGLALEEVAWGLLTTPEKWKTITELSRQDQDIRYSTVAKDTAPPLINYLKQFFLKNDIPKFILIVGHDYNQNALIHYMCFKPVHLPHQYEPYPIGGKIVFQRWTDNKNDFLKIEYVYPSWTQIRNGTEFTLKNFPLRVLLQLKWCKVNRKGFCSWSEFIDKLRFDAIKDFC